MPRELFFILGCRLRLISSYKVKSGSRVIKSESRLTKSGARLNKSGSSRLNTVRRDPELQSPDPDFVIVSRDPEIKKLTRVALMGHHMKARAFFMWSMKTDTTGVYRIPISGTLTYDVSK